MNWELVIVSRAPKSIKRFPKEDRRRIVQALQELRTDPFSGDVVKLEDAGNVWRRRVGAYRIFYEMIVQEKTIYVFRIERRNSKTY